MSETFTMAEHEAAVAAARAEERAKGEKAIVEARERAKAIVTLDEAKGREKLARAFAFQSSMTVEEARIALAESPAHGWAQ